MIWVLEMVAIIMGWVSNFFVFGILKSLLRIRKPLPLQLLAFFSLSIISNIIIYLGDAVNALGALLGFYLYILVFFEGELIPKLSVVTIIYPLIIAINYLCQDIGQLIWATFLQHVENGGIITTALHTLSFLPRALLWLGIWKYCKKHMSGIHELLDKKMWLLLDSICASVFLSLTFVISFLPHVPQAQIIAYVVSVAGIVTVIGCFYLVVYMANAIQADYQLQNLRLEYQYYEDKLKDEERVRAIYHDMKNHLLVMQSAEGAAGASDMIAAMQRQISGYENYYKTGNTFLDVIIRDKAEKAREHGIDFLVMLHFEDGGFIDPLDISTIFGNALDNAIEASLALPANARLVTVKACRVHDMLSVVIENSTAGKPGRELKTAKADKLLHGFGLRNIEKAVEKYGGECSTAQNNGRFTLTIILPIL